MRQIFLDTETTGLYADQGDRIVEVGCIEMVSRRLTGRHLHHYLNPQRASHEEALKVHGLTEAFLADKPLFSAIAAEFAEFVRGADIVIHNAAFDVGFINAELRRIGQPPLAELAGKITDSLLMAREQFPGKANSLDALCRRLEVDNTHRTLHGALMDASLLAEVYIRMTRGQNSLVIEASPNPTRQQEANALPAIDLRSFTLPVLAASDAEADAHDALLKELDKASGGKTVWRQTLASTSA
ncbi:MAG: DNA polymerase III subunit epsilon [Leptothrix sp. (in: b-proteobacteria)]